MVSVRFHILSYHYFKRTDIQIANATEEFFVRKSPLYEVVGQMGMWGVLINGIQAAGLEHKDMTRMSWSGENSA